jgi:hypothetical protein
MKKKKRTQISDLAEGRTLSNEALALVAGGYWTRTTTTEGTLDPAHQCCRIDTSDDFINHGGDDPPWTVQT